MDAHEEPAHVLFPPFAKVEGLMNEGQIEKSCRNVEAQRRNLHATSCERSLLYVYSIYIRLVNWRARFAKILDFLLPLRRAPISLFGVIVVRPIFNVHFCDKCWISDTADFSLRSHAMERMYIVIKPFPSTCEFTRSLSFHGCKRPGVSVNFSPIPRRIEPAPS